MFKREKDEEKMVVDQRRITQMKVIKIVGMQRKLTRKNDLIWIYFQARIFKE